MATRPKNPEISARALLGDLLRVVRLEAGFRTQEDLATVLGMDRTGITRTETGERVLHVEVLGEWLTQCGVTGLARKAIEGLWKLAKATSEDTPVKIWFSGYLDAEGKAHTIRIWQPLIFHGLFQTEAYARAIFAAMGLSEDKIRDMVGLRTQRQAILARAEPPNVVALFDESVLHRLIGSPEIMQEQLKHLLRLSTTHVIQVVPSKIGANAGLGGAITLAAQTGAPEVLLAEAMVEDQVTSDVPSVLQAAVTFDRVRADALSRTESRDALQEALERWNS